MQQAYRAFVAPFVFALVVLVSFPAQAVDIQKIVSPGGIKAWLVEEPSIPIVSMNVAWRGGSSLDGRFGLSRVFNNG